MDLGLFPVWDCYEQTAMSMCPNLFIDLCFLLGNYLGVEVLGHREIHVPLLWLLVKEEQRGDGLSLTHGFAVFSDKLQWV